MKVVLDFCIDADIIECPAAIVNSLSEYQSEFFKWLYDKENDHNYWIYQEGEKCGCNYRSEAFVEWLNRNVILGELSEVQILDRHVTVWDRELKIIGF